MKIKFHILLFLSILTISCNQKENKTNDDTEETLFQEVSHSKSQFKNLGSRYQYLYQGNVKNTSSNVFDEVSIHMSVEFLLNNGNVLTREDYSEGGFFSGGEPVWIKVWKSKEIVLLGDKKRDEFKGDEIKSDFIPKHYKDYPIKQVFAVLSFKATDVINQTKETYYSSIDITKEWKALK